MQDESFDWIDEARERKLDVSPEVSYLARRRKKKSSMGLRYVAVAGIALVVAVALGLMYGLARTSPDALLGLLILGTALLFYFLPTFIAIAVGHANLTAVIVLNILLGWTFIGWVAALVWACMDSQRRD